MEKERLLIDEEFVSQVTALAFKICKDFYLNHEDIEDIVNNVLLKTIQQDKEKIFHLGWIAAVIKNEAFDCLRKKKMDRNRIVYDELDNLCGEASGEVESQSEFESFYRVFNEGVKISTTELQYYRFEAYHKMYKMKSHQEKNDGFSDLTLSDLMAKLNCSKSVLYKSVREAEKKGIVGTLIQCGLEKSEMIFSSFFSKKIDGYVYFYKVFDEIIKNNPNNICANGKLHESLEWLCETALIKLIAHTSKFTQSQQDFFTIRLCFLIFRLSSRYLASDFQSLYCDFQAKLKKSGVDSMPIVSRELSVVSGYSEQSDQIYKFLKNPLCSEVNVASLLYFEDPILYKKYTMFDFSESNMATILHFMSSLEGMASHLRKLLDYCRTAISDFKFYRPGLIEMVLSYLEFIIVWENSRSGSVNIKDISATLITLEINKYRVDAASLKKYNKVADALFRITKRI